MAKCVECEAQVSENATTCPKCGTPYFKAHKNAYAGSFWGLFTEDSKAMYKPEFQDPEVRKKMGVEKHLWDTLIQFLGLLFLFWVVWVLLVGVRL